MMYASALTEVCTIRHANLLAAITTYYLHMYLSMHAIQGVELLLGTVYKQTAVPVALQHAHLLFVSAVQRQSTVP